MQCAVSALLSACDHAHHHLIWTAWMMLMLVLPILHVQAFPGADACCPALCCLCCIARLKDALTPRLLLLLTPGRGIRHGLHARAV
jgi:hypothetical protein